MASPNRTTSLGSKITHAAVSVAGETTIAANNLQRLSVEIQPTNGDIAVGTTNVTAANGIRVVAGAAYELTTYRGALQAISISGAAVDVRVIEISRS